MALEPLILLQGVREVSELAKPASPVDASQRAFDKARAHSRRFKDLPAARNIAAQLDLPWRELLRLAHEPIADHSHHLGRKQQEPAMQEWLTHEYVGFVLKFVARRLNSKTLTPRQYTLEREKVLKADRAGWLHGRQLLLPNEVQIRDAAGSWDKALALAGLAPRPGRGDQWRGKLGVPTVELLELCYQAHGTQASADELKRFARANDIRYLQPHSQDKPQRFSECVADWKVKRKAKGLPVPDGLPPWSERPDYTRDMGISLPGQKREAKWGNVEDCIAYVVRYLEQLPPGKHSTQKDYNAWAAAQDGAPDTSRFDQHGSWGSVRSRAQERLK
jgi:hypothetical protein